MCFNFDTKHTKFLFLSQVQLSMIVPTATLFKLPPFFLFFFTSVDSPVRDSVFPSRCFIDAPAVIADKQKSVMSNCPVVLGAAESIIVPLQQ